MNPERQPSEAFEFGQNWQKFLAKCYSPERLEISKTCLSSFLAPATVKKKSFVDVGCGSGLSSLAAHDLGASRLLSFDVDSDSVLATMSLRELRGAPNHWSVQHGSALDAPYVQSLGKWDIVYSWGALHHTRRMRDAIRTASKLLKPDGLFFIAIYTTTPQTNSWIRITKRDSRRGWLGRRLVEARYLWQVLVRPNLNFSMENSRNGARLQEKSRHGLYYGRQGLAWRFALRRCTRLGNPRLFHTRTRATTRKIKDRRGMHRIFVCRTRVPNG
jgi:SAM-dependent methyltransferase